jgi:hypothetical protein
MHRSAGRAWAMILFEAIEEHGKALERCMALAFGILLHILVTYVSVDSSYDEATGITVNACCWFCSCFRTCSVHT